MCQSATNERFDLITFDCDGVLVDSEPLSVRTLIEQAYEFGLRIDIDEAMTVFSGTRMRDDIREIERRIGSPLPSTFEADYRRRTTDALERELRPVEGVLDAVERIELPVCEASNGPPEKLAVTLRVTGLAKRFAGRVFSAYEVERWKPDPGLFLHAARVMGTPPSRCVVVEDSVPGVQAAAAAGMSVFGLVHPYADAAALACAGAQVFTSMSDLPGLLVTEPSKTIPAPFHSPLQRPDEQHAIQRNFSH